VIFRFGRQRHRDSESNIKEKSVIPDIVHRRLLRTMSYVDDRLIEKRKSGGGLTLILKRFKNADNA